ARIPRPCEKVKSFPPRPGVYLMKDAQGRVLYVGQAKNLRNRASHYLTKAAPQDRRTADLVKEIPDLHYLQAHHELPPLPPQPPLHKALPPPLHTAPKEHKSVPHPPTPPRGGSPPREVPPPPPPQGRPPLWPLHQRQEPPRRHAGPPARLPVPHLPA